MNDPDNPTLQRKVDEERRKMFELACVVLLLSIKYTTESRIRTITRSITRNVLTTITRYIAV
jgi:hypothetical protein